MEKEEEKAEESLGQELCEHDLLAELSESHRLQKESGGPPGRLRLQPGVHGPSAALPVPVPVLIHVPCSFPLPVLLSLQ